METSSGADTDTPLYIHTFNRMRALVLDNSYRPVSVINWQRAICMDLFDKVWVPGVFLVGGRSCFCGVDGCVLVGC